VVSLFVNPTQFGPGETWTPIPRRGPRRRVAAGESVDLLWAPDVEQIYPEVRHDRRGRRVTHRNPRGGPAEPRTLHFRGVTTVVAKLFNSVQPDVAYFGRKDAQQAIVIERMVRDLDFPIEIECCPPSARRTASR
jgi:pantoate--beta-alanine ligase